MFAMLEMSSLFVLTLRAKSLAACGTLLLVKSSSTSVLPLVAETEFVFSVVSTIVPTVDTFVTIVVWPVLSITRVFVLVAVILSLTNGRKYAIPLPSSAVLGSNDVPSSSLDSIVEQPQKHAAGARIVIKQTFVSNFIGLFGRQKL